MYGFAQSRLMSRGGLMIALSVVALAVGSKSIRAAELIMVHSPICEWCETWEHEVGVIYARTSQGGRAPLRRVDIDDVETSKFRVQRPVTYTPTFLLVHETREVGRITGYPGESHFWYFLDELLNKVPGGGLRGCQPDTPRTAQTKPTTGKQLC